MIADIVTRPLQGEIIQEAQEGATQHQTTNSHVRRRLQDWGLYGPCTDTRTCEIQPTVPIPHTQEELILTDKDSKTPSDLLPPPSYPTTTPLSASAEDWTLKTQDSVIPTAIPSDSTTPSVRVITKTDHSRHQDSCYPPPSFSSTPSSAIRDQDRTLKTSKKSWHRDIKSEERGPRPKTQFRNEIVSAVRKLF